MMDRPFGSAILDDLHRCAVLLPASCRSGQSNFEKDIFYQNEMHAEPKNTDAKCSNFEMPRYVSGQRRSV